MYCSQPIFKISVLNVLITHLVCFSNTSINKCLQFKFWFLASPFFDSNYKNRKTPLKENETNKSDLSIMRKKLRFLGSFSEKERELGLV